MKFKVFYILPGKVITMFCGPVRAPVQLEPSQGGLSCVSSEEGAAGFGWAEPTGSRPGEPYRGRHEERDYFGPISHLVNLSAAPLCVFNLHESQNVNGSNRSFLRPTTNTYWTSVIFARPSSG